MLPELQDRLVVVLVRARNPSNIGAVARAMHDFGFTQLRIVNEYPVPFAAAKSAVDASSVLASATEHTTLADAIADCSLVFGTTAVGARVLEHPLQTLDQASLHIRDALRQAPSTRVALLFGSEKTGLSNDELSHANALLTIPMSTRNTERHLSMNLGQAAAVCLYAISDTRETEHQQPTAAQATAGELARLTTLLSEALDRSGYTRRHPANVREPVLRRLVRRMANTPEDAAVWSGILRQFLHVLGK